MKSTTKQEQRVCTNCRRKLPLWQFLANPIMPNGSDPFCYRCRAHAEDENNYDRIGRRAEIHPNHAQKIRNQFTTARWKILRRDGGRCRVCGNGEGIEVHHIIPVAKGGDNAPNNLITLCLDHHRAAHKGEIAPDRLRHYVEDADYDPDMHGLLPGYDSSGLSPHKTP